MARATKFFDDANFIQTKTANTVSVIVFAALRLVDELTINYKTTFEKYQTLPNSPMLKQ